MLKLFEKKEVFQNFNLADQIAPNDIVEDTAIFNKKQLHYLRVGEVYETTLMAVDLPPEGSLGWLSDLYSINGNVSYTIHATPTGTSDALSKLDKAVKKNNRRLLEPKISESAKQTYKQDNQKYVSSIKNLINSGVNGFFSIGLTVRILAYSLKELNLLKSTVENRMGGVGITSFVPVGSLVDGFVTQLPYGSNELSRYTAREMDAGALASLFPFDSQSFRIKNGFVLGQHPDTHAKISIDIRSLANHNMVIFGDSGQGKTVAMWELICRLRKDGNTRIIIIDPENEYRKGVTRMDGTTINISNGTSDVINPLQVFFENLENAKEDEYDESTEEIRDVFSVHLQNKQEFFRLLAPSLNEVVMAYVDDCLSELYEDFSIDEKTDFSLLSPTDYPILEDLYFKIEEKRKEEETYKEKLSDFQLILKQYVFGVNKKIFNGHTNVDLRNDVICFNLKDLGTGTSMQTAAMSNTTQYIWDLITNDVRETYLFIDEMHVLNNPNSPQAAMLLKDIYKRIRKYGDSGAISATQQPSDALSVSVDGVNYGSAVFDNSTIQILLPMKSRSIQLLRDEANMIFSDEEINILTPMEHKIGEGLLLYANRKTAIKFIPTRMEWELLGKRPKQTN